MSKAQANGPEVVAIVQARLGSVRLPNKVIQKVLGRPLLEHLVERLNRATTLTGRVLAIPASPVNDDLESFSTAIGWNSCRGSELDVLDRFIAAAELFPAEAYVRITADCPLVDPQVVDALVARLFDDKVDYVRTGSSYPDGLDVEVFRASALFEAGRNARTNFEREHVTPYMRTSPTIRRKEVEFSPDLSRLRLTIDEPEDYDVLRGIFEYFGDNLFSLDQVAALAEAQPALFVGNQHLGRDAGSTMGTGEKLWSRARRVIPDGNMLLSKRAELFVPKGWPAYFSRTSGCQVWDLDDKPYFDLGYMGIGTNILGYSHSKVDEAVRRVIDAGNLSTLNCPEEVLLAEKLCELHPWAEMAKFTRSGGEACAVAVRIARAASGKDGVAFCGYHGWHDWFLAANLSEASSLDTHLLPGLDPAGVPRVLGGNARPFAYNDLEALEAILKSGDIGVVIMEVERNRPPADGFLASVRALVNRYSAVLVFDECTSGFRETLGGLHLKYGVEPDIAVFGKTLGNGYAINAVIGRRLVMEAAQTTFISSTFWTERIGPTAALAAIAAMEAEDAPARVHALGLEYRENLASMGHDLGFDPHFQGLPALTTYSVDGFNPVELRTFITERMLIRGYLATTAFYASIAHTKEILTAYFDALRDVITEAVSIGPDTLSEGLLSGTAQSGFRRMN